MKIFNIDYECAHEIVLRYEVMQKETLNILKEF